MDTTDYRTLSQLRTLKLAQYEQRFVTNQYKESGFIDFLFFFGMAEMFIVTTCKPPRKVAKVNVRDVGTHEDPSQTAPARNRKEPARQTPKRSKRRGQECGC